MALPDQVNALAQAQECITALETVASEIFLVQIDGSDLIVAVNAARELIGPAVEALQAWLGPDGHDLIASIYGHAAAVLDLANAALQQVRTPQEYTLPYMMSCRRVLFNQVGSIDNIVQFILLNRRLESYNFIPAGTVVVLPRT